MKNHGETSHGNAPWKNFNNEQKQKGKKLAMERN
jgi:hypothetical protein